MSENADQSVTRILQAAARGDAKAARDLLPIVYQELRVLAKARLNEAPPGQTLQPTALVHEAYLRLVGDDDPGWNGRGHFFGARAMRDIMIAPSWAIRLAAASTAWRNPRRSACRFKLETVSGIPRFWTGRSARK